MPVVSPVVRKQAEVQKKAFIKAVMAQSNKDMTLNAKRKSKGKSGAKKVKKSGSKKSKGRK